MSEADAPAGAAVAETKEERAPRETSGARILTAVRPSGAGARGLAQAGALP